MTKIKLLMYLNQNFKDTRIEMILKLQQLILIIYQNFKISKHF